MTQLSPAAAIAYRRSVGEFDAVFDQEFLVARARSGTDATGLHAPPMAPVDLRIGCVAATEHRFVWPSSAMTKWPEVDFVRNPNISRA